MWSLGIKRFRLVINTLPCRMQKICLIHTSVSTMSEATILADELMDTHLAACIQISGPGLSVYRWKGKVEREDEYYIQIKTTDEHSEAVIGWLKQHHPYELPEIIRTECEATQAYADWVHSVGPDTQAS